LTTVEFSDSFLAAVSLAAQRGAGNGNVTGTIVNVTTGQVILESTSSGPYAAVSRYGPANRARPVATGSGLLYAIVALPRGQHDRR
jgi:hypothetical protein